MMGEGIEPNDEMGVVARRIEFIELLDEVGPLAPRDLVDALDCSRSTVTRALSELREADLVEKTSDGYAVTLSAVMAADVYRRYETATEAILTSKKLLAPIPNEQAPPVDLLVGSDVFLAETDIPVRLLEAVSSRVRDADRVVAYLPTLVNTHLLRVWHRAVVAEAVDGHAVFDPNLLTVLKGQYPQLLAEMAAVDDFSVSATTGPTYGVILTTTGDTAAVSVIVYDNNTAVLGVVTNDSSAAVDWARDELSRFKSDAIDVTSDLVELGTGLTSGERELRVAGTGRHARDRADGVADVAEHALPLALEAEGFVRLSSEYFDAHGLASAAVSWRTGFTLSEVRAGHPVDRLDEDGRNLTDQVLERLLAGDNHVLLGPPGSGKSTICMQVACEWYERGLGPVLYHERGSGDHLKSVALLEAYLRQAGGRPLVIVEDAVREETAAIFDVMRALDGYPPVTFLLDARAREWQNTDTLALDARRDAYRLTAIDQVSVPDLDERECARFVAHFADLVDDDLNLSGPELFSMIETGTMATEGGGISVGDVLVAQHHLSQRHDPFAEADGQLPTVLDGAVRRTYETLIDTESQFALDLATLVNLLNAAGIPIAGEYLYSLSAPDEYDGLDEAVSLQEGNLLFEQNSPGGRSSTVYRTRHETWALHFLELSIDLESTRRARDRFGRCVTRLLALADERDRRREIQQHLEGRTPYLHQLEADPGNWADEIVERIFRLGRTNASLAPLYGETTADTIELPAACSTWAQVQQAYWRGEMNRLHGDLDRAEREFRTLRERADAVDLSGKRELKPTLAAVGSRHPARDEWKPRDTEKQRNHWRATSLTKLGRIAETRGTLESAVKNHREALLLFRELDDHQGEAYALNHLGIVTRQLGELEVAKEYHDESLALFRETENPHGEAYALGTRGIVSRLRGELGAADEDLETSRKIYHEIGNRRGEAWARVNRGMVAHQLGELDVAEEYYEEGLSQFREIGARRGEARALKYLGELSCRREEVDRAVEYLEGSLAVSRDIGNRRGEAAVLGKLGWMARDRKELEQARSRFAAAAELLSSMGADEAGTAFTNVIDTCELQGDVDGARDWCRRAVGFAARMNLRDHRQQFSSRLEDIIDTDELSPSHS